MKDRKHSYLSDQYNENVQNKKNSAIECKLVQEQQQKKNVQLFVSCQTYRKYMAERSVESTLRTYMYLCMRVKL